MRKLINSIIKKLKGQDYTLNERIPASYLAGLIFSRLMMAARGGISRVKHKGFLFIASRVTIKARSMFRAGRTVSIGKGCFIDALSTDGIVFGDNVSMGKNVRIECTGNLQEMGKGMKVGNNVGLGADSFFGCTGGIKIGDDTILGNYVSFHSENHLYNDMSVPIRLQGSSRKGIRVGKNCWIGAKATILDGAEIGDGCIIAASAVVVAGKYESNGIYGGVPAKLIKYREQYINEEQSQF
jgi:acetyltransferase-like isoleucine patch superfamily enzyme